MKDHERQERRRYLRHRVDLSAEVFGPARSPLVCRIRDLCLGGLRFELDGAADAWRAARGQGCDIHLDLSDPDGALRLRTPIEIVRSNGHEVGARFLNLSADDRHRLASWLGRLETKDGEPPGREEADRDAALVRRILIAEAERLLPTLVPMLMDRIVAVLWDQHEQARSNVARVLISSEIGLLINANLSGGLPQRLSEAVLGDLERLGELNPLLPDSESDRQGSSMDLELIEPDAFETWLAKTECTNRLEEALKAPLRILRAQSLNSFAGVALAIEPDPLIQSLETELRATGIGGTLLRHSLRGAEDYLLTSLGDFYRGLIRAWSEAGLTRPERAATSGAEASRSRARDRDPAKAPPLHGDSGHLDPAGSAAVPSSPTPDAEDAERPIRSAGATSSAPGLGLAQLLSDLQEPADLSAGTLDASLVEPAAMAAWHRWLEGLDTGQRTRLGSARVRERAELTDRVLGRMLADSAVTPGFKSILERLPLHFIAMALDDSGSLLESRHPLIELIDRLEQVTLFLPNGERDDTAGHLEAQRLIERLVTTDAHDLSALQELAARMGALESRLAETYRARVAHWVEVCEAGEIDRLARERVRERLNGAFAGQKVHALLSEVLEQGWRSLLESTCRAMGVDGERWRRPWEPLWGLHLATGGEARETSAADLDPAGLVEGLYRGFLSLGVDPVRINELLRRIEAATEAAEARLPSAGAYERFSELRPQAGDEEDAPPPGLSPEDWALGLERIDAVPVGALIWMRDKERLRAVRLIWRSDEGSRLALADPLGKKRFKTVRRGQLVKAFLRGRARVHPPTSRPLTRRCAEAVFEGMREAFARPAGQDSASRLDGQPDLRARLVQGLSECQGRPPDLVLGILELDRFDVIAAAHGHTLGERLMAATVGRLRERLPNLLCLADLGRGRLGFLTRELDPWETSQALESWPPELRSCLEAAAGLSPRLSASLGLAVPERDDLDPDRLLSAANLACLVARRKGGDRTVRYREEDEGIRAYLEQMRAWVRAEAAIRSRCYRLRCQRIVPVEPDRDEPPHHEILLSVFDADGSPLPLIEFITAAETLNLMREVDRQVIAATLRWLHEHPHEAAALGGVSINLSGQSLSDPELVSVIRSGLERWAISPELVGFEVTETAAIADRDRATRTLEELRAMGCRLALDDFGSGLSSFAYLKRLPVDFVKIDGAFVKNMLTNPEDRKMVRAFNEIAHFMGKRTIAEFVENEDILEHLREIGVDYAQGFGIEKPRFIDERTDQAMS